MKSMTLTEALTTINAFLAEVEKGDAARTPGKWETELIQRWPFGIKVIAGEVEVLSQHAACSSTSQNTRKDCENAVGFKHIDREAARKLVAEQDANAAYIALAVNSLAATAREAQSWPWLQIERCETFY